MNNQTALALTITATTATLGLFTWILFEDKINQYFTENKSEERDIK